MNQFPSNLELQSLEPKNEEDSPKDKMRLDDSGDETFLMSEFFYYTQNLLTLKGLYYQLYGSLTQHQFTW